MNLLQQGAEARLFAANFCGRSCIVKERFPKKYRLQEIDEKLTKKRLSQEVKALQRCRKAGILTPIIYFVDTTRSIIFLEKIDGETVRQHIVSVRKMQEDSSYHSIYPMAREIGKILAKLHDADLIHGDLTTSNMIIKTSDNKLDKKTNEIFLIDFGLSFSSSLAEDKGVDLYVLERAFLSTHPNSEELFSVLLDAYKDVSKKSSSVLTKLEEVRQRGRKRSMIG
ncbi:unnamed protein product [Clavelina lepadiformis]|uniref:non-specific serine/threonine protein kinase n=1 Tax=Clavelina lepadiformis TaxID=159417 RepID=A0ABP0GP33_CLALP